MTVRRIFLVACMLGILNVVSCGGDGDKSTTPSATVVGLTGSIDLPEDSWYDESDLTVGFGDYDEAVDEDGIFTVQGNEHIPGLAMAYDPQGTPVLLSIVPDPTSDGSVWLDAESTALALVFLNPFICTANPDYIHGVLDDLRSTPSFDDLTAVVEDHIVQSTFALWETSAELDSVLTAVVTEYVNAYPPASLARPRHPVTSGPQSPATPGDEGMQIFPDWQVSGHRLNWQGGSTFEITNSFGRWAYCTTPEDSFFVFPNGDFLDVVKGSRPWAPSQREFSMTVTPGADTSFVRLYGYGFAAYDDNIWNNLSVGEQQLAHAGGMATITIELCSQVLAVICNTSSGYGKGEIADRLGDTIFGFLLTDGVLMQQIGLYIQADDPWGLSWHLTKHIMGELTTNAEFRAAFVSATGIALTDGMIGKILKWVNVFAKGVMTYNSVTSVLKTVMALSTAEFKTSFAVWNDVVEFGAVRGQVADAQSGDPMSGATVTLTGDEGNPLEPNHEVTTGEDGHYRFYNIGVGEKSITAVKSGYNTKTVTVVIAADQEITRHIPMYRNSGGVSGKVLNGILVHHGIEPATFQETVEVTARDVAGVEYERSIYVHYGTYDLTLPAGSWWVKATYDDYHPDSFLVSITSDGAVSGQRDLVLEPNPTMSGDIQIDMNNDGMYERYFEVEFEEAGLPSPVLSEDCISGPGALTMRGGGVRGSSLSDFDFAYVGFNITAITHTADYSIGPLKLFPCASGLSATTVMLATSREQCSGTYGSGPISFFYPGDPGSPPCDCGVTQPGTVYLMEWGTELGDLVAGFMMVELPGAANCYCEAWDEDGDDINETSDIECARAKATIDFRLLVGTDYLVGWTPEGVGEPPELSSNAHK